MKKLLTVLTLATIFTIGCKKDEPVPDNKFVPGDLLIGITNNADLKTVFDTLNSLSFKISAMHGFFFNANLPADSLKTLLSFLNSKPYINNGKGSAAYAYYYEPEKSTRVLCSLIDMNPSNQSDLINTVNSLNLVDRRENTKFMYIKIPIGTEQFWLTELKKYSFIKWAELNQISRVNR